MLMKDFPHYWYAVHTRSRFENVVHDGLVKKNIEVFLPRILIRSKRIDRVKLITVPMFSGYLFVQTDQLQEDHLRILKTAGVVSLIGNTDGPVAIPSKSIESLKIMVRSKQEIMTDLKLKRGDMVIVMRGHFAGVEGIFARYKGKGRVIVNIDALGRSASVEVNLDDVEMLHQEMVITA